MSDRYAAAAVRTVAGAPDDVLRRSAVVAVALGGKVKGTDVEAGTVMMNFNKKVGARYLQNRVDVVLTFGAGASGTEVSGTAVPVDPLGRPVPFGVPGEPAREVLEAVLDALGSSGP
ncbi:MAG: hypothetical protein DWG77_05495 [Chloroflexi bacterium]|nr:hypothetical protein [Actinomycetota bacterium]MQC48534.1 hypothetical protein [Chloroflexota bacterium]